MLEVETTPKTAVVVRLPVPSTSKAFKLNDEVDDLLKDIAHDLDLSQTTILEYAIRNFAEMVRRGLPIYLSSPPEGSPPPTSAPSAARRLPQHMVENRAKAGGTPPAAGPRNTKRRKG